MTVASLSQTVSVAAVFFVCMPEEVSVRLKIEVVSQSRPAFASSTRARGLFGNRSNRGKSSSDCDRPRRSTRKQEWQQRRAACANADAF